MSKGKACSQPSHVWDFPISFRQSDTVLYIKCLYEFCTHAWCAASFMISPHYANLSSTTFAEYADLGLSNNWDAENPQRTRLRFPAGLDSAIRERA